MNFSEIHWPDTANGPGVRVSLFVSGCPHHCPGCFNPETWDPAFGQPFTEEAEQEVLAFLDKPFCSGLSLLGGEPLAPGNAEALLPLLERCRERYPQKEVWCWTGYLFNYLLDTKNPALPYIDFLVDGRFIEAKKDLGLRFKGSSNQRIIDVKQSLRVGRPVVVG